MGPGTIIGFHTAWISLVALLAPEFFYGCTVQIVNKNAEPTKAILIITRIIGFVGLYCSAKIMF